MSGQNIIPLHPSRRARSAVVEDGPIAMLVFVSVLAMMLVGLVSGFMLTRAAAGAVWPPPGQPWFPTGETAISSAALLLSGALIFLTARAWKKRPLLLGGMLLGALFVLFQGVAWAALIHQGLTLTSSQHAGFFYLIVGIHGATALGALIFLGVAWLRLASSAFSAARILWYFVVGVWPVLYVCLYL